MGSSLSLTAMKNQSLVTLLLGKVEAGQKATISNIAKSSTAGIFDSFSSDRNNAVTRQRVFQMESLLSQSSQYKTYQQQTSFQQVLDQKNQAQQQSQTDASAVVTVDLEGNQGAELGSRLEANLRQAASVSSQLNMTSEAWGVESLARDLAVFDLDFTALKGNPHDIAESIRARAQEMVNELDQTGMGDANYDQKRREISGASARLISSLQGAAGAVAVASVKLESSMASSRTGVNVDGTIVDATVIVAAANIIVDPLVLDMNGDGLDFKGAHDGVDFDMDGDGRASRMGFVRGDDALLFIDSHGDGVVHDGRQLFGNQDGYANGFEMLRSYDDNGDGVIDENDAVYDKLRLWVETTEDGQCEAGETMSLRDAGVKAIQVGYEDVREDDGNGNLIGQVGSFTRDDGTSGTAVDVWFHALANQPPF